MTGHRAEPAASTTRSPGVRQRSSPSGAPAAAWSTASSSSSRHNLVYSVGARRSGTICRSGTRTPRAGPTCAATSYQQFRGDTQLGGKVEYHFPLFSIGSLDFRALGFYDVQASLVPRPAAGRRRSPTADAPVRTYLQRDTPDARTLPDRSRSRASACDRDIHNAVGGGLRFFLRSVAVPLVGFDAGYGIEASHWQFILVVGA